MSHIVNIRGTNGSGKTTIARTLISHLRKYKDYKCENGVSSTIYINHAGDYVAVVGKYDGPTCGGCDTMKHVRDIVEAVAELSEYGHVFFEGLIISSLQQLAKDIADASPWATFHALTLDTSKEKCIEQTMKRRAIAGNDKPFDPAKSLLPKHRAVYLAALKLASWGMDSRIMSQSDALTEAARLLNVSADLSAIRL